MPELPEVTTIVRILKPKILNKQIESIDVFYRRLILNEDLDNFKNILINSSIDDIFNIGKFIVIKLNNNHRLIVHLRMEGKLFFFENQNDLPERKYSDSCLIKFKDGSYLLYNDTRKFGIFKLESVDEENSTITIIPSITANVVAGKLNAETYSVKSGDTEVTDNTLGTGYVIKLGDKEYTVVKVGDVSGDGEVNARDSLRILKYAVGTYELKDEYLLAGELSDDGEVNARDSLRVLKYAVGTYKMEI